MNIEHIGGLPIERHLLHCQLHSPQIFSLTVDASSGDVDG